LTYAGGLNNEDPGDRKYRKFSDRELLRFLLNHILRYRRSLIIVISSLLIASAVGVAIPALLAIGVNNAIAKDFQGLVLMVGLSGIAYFASYLSESKRNYHVQVMGQNVIRDLRRETFVKLQDLSPSYFSTRETGRIMSYITNDVDAVSDFVTFQVPQVLAGFVIIFSIIIVMFYVNVQLSLLSLTVIPMLVVLTLVFQKRIQQSFVETRKKIAVVTSKLQEGISGVRVTQSLVKEKQVSQNFDAANAENLEVNLRANRLTSIFNSLVQVIEAFGLAVVLWYGASEILAGQLSVGYLLAFLIYINSFFSPIIQLTTVYNSYQSAVTGLDRVMQILYTDIEVKPPEVLNPAAEVAGAPSIEFDQVTFGYHADEPVIRNVSFVINHRETVAIVGPTGAGKSSIVNLVLRFYDPQQGEVKLNGKDLKTLSFSQVRKKMSVIPQEPFLFSTTVLDNIRYGKPEATEEEVVAVAKQLGIDDFVRTLPDQYNTVVSEGATNLSMGQKQLICFARAFLSDPEVLIMDEATSGVDPVAELQLQRALSKMIKNRAAIIIAHRLSTIRLADKVIVLQAGQIVEEGDLSELINRKDGIFSEMYAMQYQSVPAA
jgi:ABC-type multidrug transport system fused ATPase/permease subunit